MARVTIDQAIVGIKALKKDLRKELRDAEKEALKRGVEIAVQLSSGSCSLNDLRKMGHPYAVRHPSPGLPPGIINRQDQGPEAFAAQWRRKVGNWSRGKMVSHITNDSPVSRYLKAGTDKMVARPIDKEVLRDLRPIRARLHRQAIATARARFGKA